MKYKGSCHCGKITFEIEGEINSAMACNCSICSRKGSLLWFVPRDQLRLFAAEQDIASYTFNKHAIKHRFCSVCGIHPFYTPRSDPDKVDVNIRCLDGDVAKRFSFHTFDGQNWEAAFAARGAH